MFLRRIARPLLAVPFIYSGIQAVIRPRDHLAEARGVVDQVSHFTGVPELSESQLSLVARAHGAAYAGAGLAMAAGVAPRASALTLAALTTPLVVANQPFTLERGVDRTARMHKFVHAVGRLGAALIAGFDYEGRPSMSWRVEHARALKEAERGAREFQAEVAKDREHGHREHGRSKGGHRGHGHRQHRHHTGAAPQHRRHQHSGIKVVADVADAGAIKADARDVVKDVRNAILDAERVAERHSRGGKV